MGQTINACVLLMNGDEKRAQRRLHRGLGAANRRIAATSAALALQANRIVKRKYSLLLHLQLNVRMMAREQLGRSVCLAGSSVISANGSLAVALSAVRNVLCKSICTPQVMHSRIAMNGPGRAVPHIAILPRVIH